MPGLSKKTYGKARLGALCTVAAAVGVILYMAAVPVDCWSMADGASVPPSVKVLHPIEGAIFPANMASPVVNWETNQFPDISWQVGFRTAGHRWHYSHVHPPFHPPVREWDQIKRTAGTNKVELVVAGHRRFHPHEGRISVKLHFGIDQESVKASLFYREVILPFSEAVKDPSQISWRFGRIDSEETPPAVLQHLPVCGNCHSFTKDGKYLAMDVDYANNKGSYIITPTAPEMRLATSDIITWDDYKRDDGEQTLGLLSQISPDGRYVLSTVKDKSVFVPKPELAFSQLFFPLKGIVAVYDRERKEFFSLPGADDPAFVQSNPVWSPDGQWILFARNRAYELKNPKVKGKILLSAEECEEFLKDGKDFRFDLCRVPFNAGKGGKAEPLRGASNNGRSNYFPKYSPDGKWIVFCQAKNYMLLQPDSELFIVPAEGGEARKLGCNLGLMNSWHSWSPDGKWLVFSSKAHSVYTQLYLTRINDQGEASPPVWLDRMVAPEHAANIPEFVPLAPGSIVKIQESFLDDYSYTRAGNEFYRGGDADHAIENYSKALSLNPKNATAHQRLGFLLFHVKHQTGEGLRHAAEAVQLEPRNAFAQYDLGMTLMAMRDYSNAIPHLAMAAASLPNGFDSQYNAIDMNISLAQALYETGRFPECADAARSALKLSRKNPTANFLFAIAMAQLGKTDETRGFYSMAVSGNPSLAEKPDYYLLLSRNYEKKGQTHQAVETAEKALRIASAVNADESIIKELTQRRNLDKPN